MFTDIKPRNDKLHIYHEGNKRRIFVAELIYLKNLDQYELTYDEKYANSKSAIPVGPDLSLLHLKHKSEQGKIFSSFLDRIPDPENPAYPEYCEHTGIAVNEDNPIILLGTIGKRGPSSFIYELVYQEQFNSENIKNFREKLNLTQHDFAEAFGISKVTLQRIESGNSYDQNTLHRIQIILKFPEVALWQLQQTGCRVHINVLSDLYKYFYSLQNNDK